jgi:branched-chain amino acid aminotransferase
MAVKKSEKIWHDGRFIPWDEARIHVMSHVVNYGSAVFEGVRCYTMPAGPAIFRLKEHVERLFNSAKIYRMDVGYSPEQLTDAMRELVRVNRLEACYVRPIVLRGYGDMGVYPGNCPVEVFLACWEWGKYLGKEALEQGTDVCISSWARMAPNTLPAMSKAAANYMNSQLVRMEAMANGYAEGIALDVNGFISEGSGENVFVVKDGTMHTPPLASAILPGITRDTVLRLARDLGIPVVEQVIPREALYIADEVIFSGTAVEITPVRSVDKISIGSGNRGPITRALQEEFFAIIEGRKPDRHGWLWPINVKQPTPALR